MTDQTGAAAKNPDPRPRFATESGGVPQPTSGGIFDGGLGAYRTVTENDYRALLTSGLVVLDTNALLDLYRYHVKTRDELIAVLRKLDSRLWVPHQVMLEFFERRLPVIESHSQEIDDTINQLSKSCTAIEVAIRRWANRVGFPERRTAELIDMIGAAVDDAAKRIRNLGEDHSFENAQDTTQDPIIAALESILNGKVGYPLPSHELVEARKAARQRILDRIPPGWKDSGKRENPDGDYLIWYQTLMEAKHRGVNVLFVTGDVKDDWWWKEHGEARGPLPELVHEMQTVANVRLFMLRPESLLKHAGHILGISVSKESVQDAARVSSKESIGWSTGTGSNQVTQAYSYPTATVWANYNDPMAAYSFPLTFGVAAPWTYGNATTSTISPLLPIERAPSNEQEFARKAQRIASDESIAALSVEGYDASADAVILDSHNWPLSDRTIKRIAEAAQSLRVKYRLQTSPRL